MSSMQVLDVKAVMLWAIFDAIRHAKQLVFLQLEGYA